MFMSGGKIHLIGLGPGDRALLTPAAAGALERCDVVVGYDGYIEQVRDLVEGKQVVSMPLGKEMERAAKAAELADALACRLASFRPATSACMAWRDLCSSISPRRAGTVSIPK